jgi:hypothetical protein
MPTIRLRYTAPVVLCGLMAFLPGCMGGFGDSKQEDKAGAAVAGEEGAAEGDLKNPILRELDQSLGEADDLEDGEEDQAKGILREADPILSRIKEENRKGLQRANNPPRRVVPRPAREPESEQDKDADESSNEAEK